MSFNDSFTKNDPGAVREKSRKLPDLAGDIIIVIRGVSNPAEDVIMF